MEKLTTLLNITNFFTFFGENGKMYSILEKLTTQSILEKIKHFWRKWKNLLNFEKIHNSTQF